MGISMSSATAAKKDELKVLFPEETLKLSDRVIKLHPFKFKNFSRVLSLANKYLALMAGDAATEDDEIVIDRGIVGKILDSGEEAIEDMAELVGMCSNCDRTTLDELDWPDAVELVFSILSLNADFFVKKIQSGGLRLGAVMGNPSPGELLPSDLSEPDSPEKVLENLPQIN
jgi:hypothetical protein